MTASNFLPFEVLTKDFGDSAAVRWGSPVDVTVISAADSTTRRAVSEISAPTRLFSNMLTLEGDYTNENDAVLTERELDTDE